MSPAGRGRHPAVHRATLVVAAVAGLLMLALATAGPAGGQVPLPTVDDAVIQGVVINPDGGPAVGVKAELYTALADGSPDEFLRPAFTDLDGGYGFDALAADCYIVIIHAPAGTSLGAGAASTSYGSCVDPGQVDASGRAELTFGRSGDYFDLSILHIADHRSHIRPGSIELRIDDEPVTAEIGGLARVATKLAERRAELGPDTVTIHSGGALGGSVFYDVFGGAADAAVMNTICFDLYGPGNAPTDAAATPDTQAVFERFLAAGDCGTEVLDREAFSVREVGEDVVGFVAIPSESLGRPAGRSPDRLDDAELAGLAEVAQQRIDMLLERGIDQIVAITDIGLGNDLALARRLSDIDAIVGRASRSLLGDFSDVGLDPVGSYPEEVVNINAELVCVGHAWHNAWLVGELTVTFDGLGGVEACGGTAHLLLAEGPTAVAENPDVVTAIDSYARSLEPLSQESIGTASERICRTGIPGRGVGLVCTSDAGAGSMRPDDIQQLLGHAMRDATGAEIAIMNAAVAADGLPAGPITIDEIYRALPHGHTLTYLEMTGAEVEAALEDGIRAALGPGGRASAFPHGVGVRWIADVSGSLDCRVEGLEIRLPGVAAWQPIDPGATYIVVTTDHLAGGGDGYRTLAAVSADGRATTTGIGDATAFIDYVTGENDGVVIPGLTEPKVADAAADGS